MPEASPIEKISPSKSEAHGRIVAWSGDHGSKVCVARMRANVSNWLSSTTSQQQFPPLSVFRVYPLIPVIPVIPVILYCNGRECRAAGVQDRRYTWQRKEVVTTLLPVYVRVYCPPFCYCTARTCCGPSFVRTVTDWPSVSVCPWVCPWALCCRSRMRSMIPCKPQIYYCRKTKRDL